MIYIRDMQLFEKGMVRCKSSGCGVSVASWEGEAGTLSPKP